jgi:hypothetical protein
MGKLTKAEKEKLAKMRGDALRYVENLSEKDKESLATGVEIMVKLCNKMNIGIDMLMFLYLSSMRKIGLLIEYNSKVVDHKAMLTTVSGSNELAIKREATYLSDTVLTESEIWYLVDIGLLEKDILDKKIHAYDSTTRVWDLGEYMTMEAKMLIDPLKASGAIALTQGINRYLDLWEIWPKTFTSGSNSRVYSAKPSGKDANEDLAKVYAKHVPDEATHKAIMRYAEENSHRFTNGLKTFIENKQWEGKLSINQPNEDLNNLL